MDSYRIGNCANCYKQMKLCRSCDRGNIYCSKACTKMQRKRSLRNAGRKYQQAFKGRCKHAARQKCYRRRKKKKVTHQGTQPAASYGFLDLTTKQEIQQESLQPEVGIKEKASSVLQEKPEAPDLIRCDICGCWCGPFARQTFWHGGRNYKKLRRKHHDRKRNGGRDSPSLSRRRLVSKHN